MAQMLAAVRCMIAVLALCFVFGAVSASAQQPSTVNPTADSVKEEQLLDAF